METQAIQEFLTRTAAEAGIKILTALVFWFVGRWLIGRVIALMRAAMSRNAVDPTLTVYLGSMVAIALNVTLILGILGYFGIQTTSFAALVAGAGVAIGAAWSGMLGNFAAGAFMLVLRPFKVGDFVNVGGVNGTVHELGLFGTTVITPDNVMTVVGNGKIFADTIQNFSALPVRRVDRTAQLAAGVDPLDAIARLRIPTRGLAGAVVNCLAADLSGRIWVGTNAEIAVFDDGRFRTMTPTNGPARLDVSPLLFTSDGGHWAVANGRARKARGREWVWTREIGDGLTGPFRQSVNAVEDRRCGIWFPHYGKGLLHVRADGSARWITVTDGLPGNRIRHVLEDREGNIWLAVDRGGLVRLRDARFQVFSSAERSRTPAAASVAEDDRGSIWIGSVGAGLQRFRDGIVESAPLPRGSSEGFVFSIFPASDGRLWMSADREDLFYFDGTRVRAAPWNLTDRRDRVNPGQRPRPVGCTGTLGFSANASFPSPNGFSPAYDWNNGVPSYPAPPFFDPSLNTGFVTGRGPGGSVTYGDPEIGGRPPRYQNWSAGLQYQLTPGITVGAAYAGSRGDFLGGAGRGFYPNQLDPRYLILGNLLTQQATAANLAAARAIVPDVALPYPNFSGTIGQMLRPFPQYSGVADVYGNVAWSNYHSMQLTFERRRSNGLTLNANYTFSRTEDNLAARTGYNFDQDWAVGVNDQPHVFNAMVVYDLPFGAAGQPGSGNAVVRAIVSGWQVSGITQFRSGRPLGAIMGACNLPANAGGCYADFNPASTGDVRINGDYGDGDVLGPNPPSYIDRTAFVSAQPFTFGNTQRTLTYDLRNPGFFNQDLSVQRDIRLTGTVRLKLGVEIFNLFNNVVFGGINTNITNANFGRVSSQTNTPRVAQLKVRVEF